MLIVTCPYHLTLDSLIRHAEKHSQDLRGLDCFDLHHFAKMFFDANGFFISADQLPTCNKHYYTELSKLS